MIRTNSNFPAPAGPRRQDLTDAVRSHLPHSNGSGSLRTFPAIVRP